MKKDPEEMNTNFWSIISFFYLFFFESNYYIRDQNKIANAESEPK